ncbi:MAG: hypothetical protein R3E79_18370 [Caldilineaceae bacterium]
MDGVPAGSYYVVGVVNGERVSAEISDAPAKPPLSSYAQNNRIDDWRLTIGDWRLTIDD